MTMPADQQPPPNNLGAIWASLTQSQREKVLKDTAEQGRKRFDLYRDLLRTNLGLRKPPPDVAIQMYQMRSPLRWAEIFEFQPQMYLDDMRDFRRLAQNRDAEPAPVEDEGPQVRAAGSMY